MILQTTGWHLATNAKDREPVGGRRRHETAGARAAVRHRNPTRYPTGAFANLRHIGGLGSFEQDGWQRPSAGIGPSTLAAALLSMVKSAIQSKP